MSDGESTAPAPRQRPSYGLPGPSASAPEDAPSYGAQSYGAQSDGAQSYGGPSHGTPSHGTPSYGSPSADWPDPRDGAFPAAQDPYLPQTGPLPGGGGPAPVRPRRRGLWPLLIGLAMLLLIGPAALIGGLVWTMSTLSSDVSSGPTVVEGSTAEVEVSGNQMLIVYVPQEDVEAATCTVEGTSGGAITTVPSSTEITFPDGSRYVQVLGAVAVEDTTATISCTGTDAPAYMGPFDALGMVAPALIGVILAVLVGLVGLVLTTVGIVLLLRSRRS